jgi:hypothetical protein
MYTEKEKEIASNRPIEEMEAITATCEKCGGETGEKMVGDESYQKCGDCGWFTLN